MAGRTCRTRMWFGLRRAVADQHEPGGGHPAPIKAIPLAGSIAPLAVSFLLALPAPYASAEGWLDDVPAETVEAGDDAASGDDDNWFADSDAIDTSETTGDAGNVADDVAADDPLCTAQEALLASVAERREAGNLGEAAAILSAVDMRACPAIAGRVAEMRVGLATDENALVVAGSRAVASCDAAEITRLRDALQQSALAGAQDLLLDMQKLDAVLSGVEQRIADAAAAYAARDLDRASASLDDASAAASEFTEAGQCRGIASRIEAERERVSAARSALAQADAALSACDAEMLSSARDTLAPLRAVSPAYGDVLSRLNRRLGAISGARYVLEARSVDTLSAEMTSAAVDEARADVERAIRALGELEPACADLGGELDALAKTLTTTGRYRVKIAAALKTCAADELAALLEDPVVLGGDFADEIAELQAADSLRLVFEEGEKDLRRTEFESAAQWYETILLAQLDSPYCPELFATAKTRLVAIEELARLEDGLQAAFDSCDMAAIDDAATVMAKHAAIVPALSENLSIIETGKQRHADLMGAREAAMALLAEGKSLSEARDLIARASEGLRDVEPGFCRGLRTKAEGWVGELEALQELAGGADEMLSSCPPEDLPDQVALIETWQPRSLTRRLAEFRQAAEITAPLGEVNKLIRERRFVETRRLFNDFIDRAQAGSGVCATRVRYALANIKKLDKAITVLDHMNRAIRRCDLKRIRADRNVLNGSSLAAFPDELRKLEAAYDSCRKKKRTAANARCRRNMGRRAYAKERSPGDFVCGCRSPYKKGSSGKCETPRAILVANAHKACRSKYGSASEARNIKSASRYTCGCRSPYVMWNDKCQKPTGRALRRYATEKCQASFGKLVRPVKIRSPREFQCRCSNPNKWTKDRKRCYRPSTKEMIKDGWDYCRRTYGSRLTNAIIQKDGRVTCYFRR